jgi:hypothetical protein
MSENGDHVTLAFDEILADRAKAYRFRMGRREPWIPKSVCEVVCEPSDTLPGEVDVASWFVIKEELEEYAI